MGRRLSFVALLVAAVGCREPASSTKPSNTPHSSEGAREPARRVLLLSIDGLRPDYLEETTHALPHLRKLRDEGAHARGMHGIWPTVTYPAHTTIVTGARPARHGILANGAFDPFEKNDGGWYWYASDIRVPTLWDVAADAGIRVANVTWPVTVGARIPYNLPQYWRSKIAEDEKLFAELATPGLWNEVAKAHEPPGEHRSDRARADAAVHLLRTRQPGLALVYFADFDTVQHVSGPMSPQAWDTLEKTDVLVGDVLAAAADPKLTVAIVSDHGFAAVDTDVRPNVALRRAGFLTAYTKKKDGRTEDVLQAYDAVSWRSGAAVALMGREGRAEPVASRVKDLFRRLSFDPANRIGAVLDGEEVEREGGFPGAICVLVAAPGAQFSERYDEPMVAATSVRGQHGLSPHDPQMDATFLLWGDGVQPGPLGEVEMIDVGPTLASLLGLTLPAAEGRPIVRALR